MFFKVYNNWLKRRKNTLMGIQFKGLMFGFSLLL